MFKSVVNKPKYHFTRRLKVARYFPVNYKYDGMGYYEPKVNVIREQYYAKNKHFIDKIKEAKDTVKTKIDAIDSRIVEKNNFIDQMKDIIKDLDVNLRTGEIKNPSFRFEMEK